MLHAGDEVTDSDAIKLGRVGKPIPTRRGLLMNCAIGVGIMWYAGPGLNAASSDAAEHTPLPPCHMLEVPQQYPTIQQAIDAAKDGDTVMVSPGVYLEGLTITGKQITLTSHFERTRNPADIEATILDGTITGSDGLPTRRQPIILVQDDTKKNTRIVGFTIRGGDDGISCHASILIEHNHFTDNVDAIDYEGGGGLCRANRFTRNQDDAVDLDQGCAVVVVDNEIADNDDDGIEIRLHPYEGKLLEIVIAYNRIRENREDGIQIIDYPGLSPRWIRIDRNLIQGNAMAAVGCMGNGNTRENFEAAGIPEPIEILHNTFVDNEYGITGGDQAVVANNIFIGCRRVALKKVAGNSVTTHNLYWNNGIDFQDCPVARGTVWNLDPRLDAQWRPLADSPCIDQALLDVPRRPVQGVDRPNGYWPQRIEGTGPDLGAFEVR